MSPKITASLRTVALIAGMLILVGCNKSCTANVNFNSGTSSSDWNVNGRRTITRSHDGITRKLETTSDVRMKDGKINSFPKGAVVKLQQTGGPDARQAELRESEGSLELWIKDVEGFRKATPEDEAWLERFLKDIIEK